MIDKALLTAAIERNLADTGLYLVDLTVSAANDIEVEIDSFTGGVDINRCVELTRSIEAEFDRDAEDYSLMVCSSGITTPFKVRAQYEKNIGKEVEVLTTDGRKLRGTLTRVGEGDALDRDVSFAIESMVKVKEPGAKRPVMKTETTELSVASCKYVRLELQF